MYEFSIKYLKEAISIRESCIKICRKDAEQAKRARVEVEDLKEALRKLEER